MTEEFINVTVTSLEMLTRPARPLARAPSLSQPVMLLRAHQPTISFYRYLYNTVGQEWLWYERRQMSDEVLTKIIHDKNVSVDVLYCGGVPAGYTELDARMMPAVEVTYLGLIQDFIGRGLGRFIVDWAVDAAWDLEPERVWIHTCNLDHPAALPTYQKAGFSVFNRQTMAIPNPRLLPSFAKFKLMASSVEDKNKTVAGSD